MKRALVALGALLPWSASHAIQSALDAQGAGSRPVALLVQVLFAGGAILFFATLVVAAVALLARRRGAIGSERLIVAAGVVLPVILLSALLIYALEVSRRIVDLRPPSVRLEVTGERWWWRVRYLDEEGRTLFATANEIRVPVGEPVEISLRSADVIHSFWVPSLAGKIDMIPGQVNRLRLEALRAGRYRGQCAEYCGLQHARMAFFVVAQPKGEFERWMAGQREGRREARTAQARRGEALFLAGRCVECHAVRGTPATGSSGPDLTHVGSRLSLGAGMLPNNRGTMAGWIASSQEIKPGNAMPSFGAFSGEDLRAVAAYLSGLE